MNGHRNSESHLVAEYPCITADDWCLRKWETTDLLNWIEQIQRDIHTHTQKKKTDNLTGLVRSVSHVYAKIESFKNVRKCRGFNRFLLLNNWTH